MRCVLRMKNVFAARAAPQSSLGELLWLRWGMRKGRQEKGSGREGSTREGQTSPKQKF